MKNKFTAIHLHSNASARDALIQIPELITAAKKYDICPILTDHGTIANWISFYNEAKKQEVKVGFGCEIYVNQYKRRLLQVLARLDEKITPAEKKKLVEERDFMKKQNHHLILVAKNEFGFYNIIELVNHGYLEGFYNKPLLDYNDLFEMKKQDGDYGVLITSACLGGPISQYILNKDIKSASNLTKVFKDYFGKNFFLEVQANGIKEQKIVNKILVALGEKHGVNLVIGTDSHYMNHSDSETHQDLLLLQDKKTRADVGKIDFRITYENKKGETKTKKCKPGAEFKKGISVDSLKIGKKVDKDCTIIDIEEIPRTFQYGTDLLYFKSENSVREDVKKYHPELKNAIDTIIKNNYSIFSKLEDITINTEIKLPTIPDVRKHLIELIKTGMKEKRLTSKRYIDRVKFELDVINKNGFETYFYILADVLNHCKANDIPLGAGRGSVVSSLVAYVLGLHRIDPLEARWSEEGLPFERFLSTDKGRVGFPDIDTDLGINMETDAGRDFVVDYLIEKYGSDYVSFVGTRLTYSGKSVLRDLGQVYGISSSETFAVSKVYNNDLTVEENIKFNTDVRTFFVKHSDLRDKVDRLTGAVSSFGTHAGGVVISDKARGFSLKKFCALQRPSVDNDKVRIATAWTKDELQGIGLIKYDLLGLTAATQIHQAQKMIGVETYTDFPEEPEVFQNIVLNGKHKNIFQFETQLGQKAFRDLMPMTIMELANASGIIRVVGSPQGRAIYESYKDSVERIQQGDKDYWEEKLRLEIEDKSNYEICKEVLAESYGVLIYQEQLAYLVSKLSRGAKTFNDGNQVRKLLDKHGKKFGTLDKCQGNRDLLKKWHDNFMPIMKEYILPYIGKDGYETSDYCLKEFLNFKLDAEHNLPVPEKGIIQWMISASAYLFSKLHAIAYSQNSYDMMYLKHYYPQEFWTSALICESGSLDKIKNYISAIKSEKLGIKILKPDVNKSFKTFSMEGKNIRFGLNSIMNVQNVAENIIRERELNGDYKSLQDFCGRVKVNKKVIENLMYAGAFSSFGDLKVVYKELSKHVGNLDDLIVTVTDLALREMKVLGTSLTFHHPLLERAEYYPSIAEFEDGMAGDIVVNIIKIDTKMTKKNKAYALLKCVDVKSGESFNVFDWGNNQQKFKNGDFQLIHIGRSGDFTTLRMSNNYQGKRKW